MSHTSLLVLAFSYVALMAASSLSSGLKLSMSDYDTVCKTDPLASLVEPARGSIILCIRVPLSYLEPLGALAAC